MKKDDLYQERYRIINMLGKGGLGEVYLAHDNFTKRKVAIKIYNNKDIISTARIQREVEIISNLKHPNILTLFDVGFFQDTYYLIQEYIDGMTLENEIENDLLTIKNAIIYTKDLLSALSYLHENNVIHRDLKPSNVLINKINNKAILSDFGISKIETDWAHDSLLTQPGGFIGTPAYMAPEQMENINITLKADIYSLGLVIYRMFSGKLPFNHKNMNEIFTRVNTSYTVTIENESLIGIEKLEVLIESMLSIKPEQRPEIEKIIETINILDELNTNNTEHIENDLKANSSGGVNDDDPFELKVDEKKHKSGTGFFSDEKLRQQEIVASREFYRSHLDLDYKTLLTQAKISFWLWFSTLVIGFIIIVSAIVLLFIGKPLESGGMTISEVFVYIVQNIFKLREDHYREQANSKTKHLEIGNYWNLITQSIDAIEEKNIKTSKLTELIDNLNSHIKTPNEKGLTS